MCACVCLTVWGIWHDHIPVEAGREDLFPRDWSSAGCKLLNVHVGSQTQVLRKSSTYSQLLSCPSSLGLNFWDRFFAVYLSRLFNSLHCPECPQTYSGPLTFSFVCDGIASPEPCLTILAKISSMSVCVYGVCWAQTQQRSEGSLRCLSCLPCRR